MYTKLFKSLFEGSMRGQSDVILVWTNLLAHADQGGFVDRHFRVIADETGLPMERVRSAITILESPDIDSRSSELEGRRLERIDEHRDWGWRVVNHAKYQVIRNAEERREQIRLAQERFREKQRLSNAGSNQPSSAVISSNQPSSAVISSNQPSSAVIGVIPLDVDVDVDVDKKTTTPLSAKPTSEEAKNSQLLRLWNETCTSLPKVRASSKARKAKESLRLKERPLSEWQQVFQKINTSSFCRGEGGKGWKATYDWIISNEDNALKVLEGKYDDKESANGKPLGIGKGYF